MDDNDSNDDDREPIGPDTSGSRFKPIDSEHDYGETSGWSGEIAEAEATLQAIEQEAITSKGESEIEGRITPAGDQKAVKRYRLREPETADQLDTVVESLLSADHFGLVSVLVYEPSLSRQDWDRKHTFTEREKLWQLCCDFIRAEELVPFDLIEQAEQQRQENR